MLKDFTRDYAVWDPMPLWDGRRYLLYVLAMDRAKGADMGTFFTRDNAIHVFESQDMRRWNHLGIAFEPRTPHERLCAGNPYLWEGRYWFFGSATVDQYDDQHLDQRLFLAVSDDGVNFREVPEFRLEPDPSICPHNRFHPVDGRMLFAWRDPWPFRDPATGRFHLFICAGGERWGRAPDVVVASSDRLDGPYSIEDCAIEMPTVPGNADAPAIWEIERVNVRHEGGRYYLTFSCWERLVHPEALAGRASLGEPLRDSSVYVMEADSATGPYRFSPGASPVVAGSHQSGFYGTTFLETSERGDIAIGWHWPEFTVDFARASRLIMEAGGTGMRLSMRWSWHQWPARKRLLLDRWVRDVGNRCRRWVRKLVRLGRRIVVG